MEREAKITWRGGLRRPNWISTLYRPAQSPDSNPIEAVWLILKELVRRRYHKWRTIAELKAIIQQEWARIDQNSITRRVSEMPKRYTILIEGGSESVWKLTLSRNASYKRQSINNDHFPHHVCLHARHRRTSIKERYHAEPISETAEILGTG